MKIQFCSDLHLEFPENKALLNVNPIQVVGDIMILAGDIVPFVVMHKHDDFFDFLADSFKYTYWVPGNHEYYYSDIRGRTGKLYEKIRENVFLVNNVAVTIEEVQFLFSTLWSRISPENQFYIQQRLSDFHVIKHERSVFSPFQYNRLHEQDVHFIAENINELKAKKTIVVTHHVPTMFKYPEEYKGDALNEAFATELYDFIEKSKIDYWIFGHHHSSVNSFNIGKTNLLTNQLGYVKYNEHGRYCSDRMFEP